MRSKSTSSRTSLRQFLRRHRSRLRSLLLTLLGAILGIAAGLSIRAFAAGGGDSIQARTSQQMKMEQDCRFATCKPVINEVVSKMLDDSDLSYSDHSPAPMASTSANGIDLLFVGVMTAQKFLATRALAINDTWATSVPGQFAFFVGEDTPTTVPELSLPIIRLKGVQDSAYPPQMKSLFMLKYMHDHYLNRFEWFMRADDDVYVRTDKLEAMLRSINSSRTLYIGQAGLGTPEEYGTLSLGDAGNYCMGGTGMVLSQETLRLIGPNIDTCLSEMATTHEDVEVGRCIRKYAGVTCTWSYEMQTLFYNNQSGPMAYTGDLNVAEVHKAITMHPLKQPRLMRRMHANVKKLKLSDLRLRSMQISRDIRMSAQASSALSTIYANQSDLLQQASHFALPSSLTKFKPATPDDILAWEFMSPSVIFCAGAPNCPRHNVESYQKYALNDVVRQVMEIINKYARQRGRVLEFQEILYGYRRVDPLHGAEYIIDLLMLYKKFKGRRMTVPVRRHAYIQQSFAELEVTDEGDYWAQYKGLTPNSVQSPKDFADSFNRQKQNERINIILSISGRLQTFQRFIANFEQTCLKAGENVSLIVVVFRTSLAASPSSAAIADNGGQDDRGRHKRQVYFGLNDDRHDDLPQMPHLDENAGDLNAEGANDHRQFDGNDNDKTADQENELDETEADEAMENDAHYDDIEIMNILAKLKNKYPEVYIDWIERSEAFNRGLGLSIGSQKFSPNSLLFFTDVDIVFTREALTRIRFNTVFQRQVYFPIVFSEYDPDFGKEPADAPEANDYNNDRYPAEQREPPNMHNHADEAENFDYLQKSLHKRRIDGDEQLQRVGRLPNSDASANGDGVQQARDLSQHFRYDEDRGYFRHFGFGIVSLYRGDLDTVGGLKTTIQGWGLEDVDLFDKFIKYGSFQQDFAAPSASAPEPDAYAVIRVPEPGLVHVYHPIHCDPKLPKNQMKMCLGSKAANLASQRKLAQFVLERADGAFAKYFDQMLLTDGDKKRQEHGRR